MSKVSQVILTSLLCSSLFGAEEPTVQANRINVRQIEGGGIGYGQGYTTLEAFLTPYKTVDTWLPFVDLRAHRFDNDKYAFNAGFGARFVSGCMVWGGSVYYDYRQTRHRNYKQVGVGLEALGTHWDWRINGYIPVGGTKSGYYQVKFDKFKGHSLYVNAKREFDMGGANAEAAYHWMPTKNIELTGALGPYYFRGKYNQFAAGGQARVKATFLDAISIEGIGSYDNLFKWNGQGQLTFSIPLGPKLKTRTRCDNNLAKPVQRFEIIVADSHKQAHVAINPATGKPFNFVFVNNDPSTTPDGSFENPFTSLNISSAPGDIVYVFGSGIPYTTMGTAVFNMQDNQWLWGSGINHGLTTSIGSVNVPAATAVYPILSNGPVAPGNIINLANNNVVSGFYFPNVDIVGPGPNQPGAIVGVEIRNAIIENNIINLNGSMGQTSIGIAFQDCSGIMTVTNNTVKISDMNSDYGVVNFSIHPGSFASYNIVQNTFIGNMSSNGIYFVSENMAPITLTVQNNLFSQWNVGVFSILLNNPTGSIAITGNNFNSNVLSSAVTLGPGVFELSLTDNTFMNKPAGGSTVVSISMSGAASVVSQINNNLFQGNTGTNTLNIQPSSTTNICLQLNYNVFDLPAAIGTPGEGPFNLENPIGNTGLLVIDPSVTIVPPGTCQ